MLESENHLASWFAVSMMLMTASLVFYHMTSIKNPSLPVNPYVSSFVASGLILAGVIYCLTALIPYNLRVKYEIKNVEAENEIHESNYVIMYNIIGSFMVLLQLIICFYIIKDSFSRAKFRYDLI